MGLYYRDDDIVRTVLMTFWVLAEPIRLTAGWYGNLQENVSEAPPELIHWLKFKRMPLRDQGDLPPCVLSSAGALAGSFLHPHSHTPAHLLL